MLLLLLLLSLELFTAVVAIVVAGCLVAIAAAVFAVIVAVVVVIAVAVVNEVDAVIERAKRYFQEVFRQHPKSRVCLQLRTVTVMPTAAPYLT